MIITRNDGSRAFRWVDYTVTAAAAKKASPYKILSSYNANSFSVKASSVNGDLKEVRVEVWDAKKAVYVGPATAYKTVAAKPTDTLTIKEIFAKNAVYKAGTTYQVKAIIAFTDGSTRSVNWGEVKVPANTSTSTNTNTAVKEPVVFSTTTTGFTAKVTDAGKKLKEVRVEIYDADGKVYVGHPTTYLTKAAKPTDTVTVTENFSKNGALYRNVNGITDFSAKIISVKTDGTRDYVIKKFKVPTSVISPMTVTSTISKTDAKLVVSDDLKNLKEVRVEVYETNGKELGQAVPYLTKATKKTVL